MTFFTKFSGGHTAAKSYIEKSFEKAKGYFKDPSFGSTLTLIKIGNIVYENKQITIEDIKSKELREMTFQRRESAHMILYYVGEYLPNLTWDGRETKTFGQAGCIGCICRPDSNRTLPNSDWGPRGISPDFKHCIVAKTTHPDRSTSILKQGKVRSFK